MNTSWFEGKLAQFKDDVEFLTEEKILDLNEQIVAKMHERGINRAEFAKRLGVTKLLNGNPNLTIKSMVSISKALDCKIDIDIYNSWLIPKTFYLVSNDKFRSFEPILEGCEYDIAA